MKPILAAMLTAAGVALFSGCGRKADTGRAESAAPVAVLVQAAQERAWPELDAVVGTVHAKTRAAVAAQASGTIAELRVEAGQLVKKGEVLAVLDLAAVKAQLRQAEAAKAQAESAKTSAAAELERAQADLTRYAKLVAQDVVARQDFERVKAQALVAESAVASADGAIAQATARMAEAATVLGYASVTAPFDGVVTAKLVERGDLAQPGRPLVEVADPATLQLEALLPEAIAGRVKVGAEFAVALGDGGKSLPAKVSEIAPVADSVSRTVLVKLPLPPECGAVMGGFGRLLVPAAESAKSVVVPESAVVVRGQLEMVFVVVGEIKPCHPDGYPQNPVAMRLVKTGDRRGGEVQILSGLEAGEKVVFGEDGRIGIPKYPEGGLTIIRGASVLIDGQEVYPLYSKMADGK